MDVMNFVAKELPASQNNIVKSNASSTEKNTTKKFGNSNEKQEKGFGNILKQITEKEDSTKNNNGDKTAVLPMALMNSPIVVIEMNTAPQLNLMAETSENVIAGLPEGLLTKQENQVDGFSTELKNLIMESTMQQDEVVNNIVNTKDEKPISSELLNMLNGKTANQIQMSGKNLSSQIDNKQQGVVDLTDLAKNNTGLELNTFSSDKSELLKGNLFSNSQKNSIVPDLKGNLFSDSQKNSTVLDFKENKSNLDLKLSKEIVLDFAKPNNLEKADENLTNNMISKTQISVHSQLPNQESSQPLIPEFISNVVDVRTSISPLANQSPVATETSETLSKYNIPDQIIEQARLIKTNEDTQMIIKLRPEHLGELTLKVTVENGVVNATFHSDNVNVRSMLETTLFQLKQELISQGIKIDNVSVYAGLGQFLSDGQGQANREQQNTKYKNKKIDLADFVDEVEKINPVGHESKKNDGVDYRI